MEFVPRNYTVTEGTDNYANVTVRATGFPGASYDVPDIVVLLTTEDGTAMATSDYEGVIRDLRFSSDGEWVVMIPILDNSPVEDTEIFLVNLATNSPFVVFNNNVGTVEILDNDCRSPALYSHIRHTHTHTELSLQWSESTLLVMCWGSS